jgi:hypothetical protein
MTSFSSLVIIGARPEVCVNVAIGVCPLIVGSIRRADRHFRERDRNCPAATLFGAGFDVSPPLVVRRKSKSGAGGGRRSAANPPPRHARPGRALIPELSFRDVQSRRLGRALRETQRLAAPLLGLVKNSTQPTKRRCACSRYRGVCKAVGWVEPFARPNALRRLCWVS